MVPTDVAKIIAENLPKHEMIEKVCETFKLLFIINSSLSFFFLD